MWYIAPWKKGRKVYGEIFYFRLCSVAIHLPQHHRKENKKPTTFNEARNLPKPLQWSTKCHCQERDTGLSPGSVLKVDHATFAVSAMRTSPNASVFILKDNDPLLKAVRLGWWLSPKRGGNVPAEQTVWLCRNQRQAVQEEEMVGRFYDCYRHAGCLSLDNCLRHSGLEKGEVATERAPSPVARPVLPSYRLLCCSP